MLQSTFSPLCLATITETVKVIRGTVKMFYWTNGTIGWIARDNSGVKIADGNSGNSRAYAVTDGNISLIRAGAAPF